ncbi:mycothiol system anti-sigma-R factor [Streptomyces durbertensis]|uniref:Mycothiol system anti-sigma-R factor n=1 Tax=Streptomyces durbertensis TaxID=2448886 RepID=A0ABR6EMC1_9ACTN|nr:mycothiol system anti-sigma-R factor [Streptomyces durbertensis]MBB1246476.1 mycothiol system anti-sigma-R factor [Streptomyces durbertensis]
MSSSDPNETNCSEVLDHLYEYLDQEMPDCDRDKLAEHFDECSPCLEKYGLEQAVKKLVKRCCGHDEVPTDLRSKVMSRIELIRAGQAVPEQTVVDVAGYTHPAPSAEESDEDPAASSSPRRNTH